MKFSVVLIVLIFCCACSQKANLQKVDFLIGTWKMEGKESYETWEKSEDQLSGKSYKIIDKQKYVSEKLKIKLLEGHLIYIATVIDQNDGEGIYFTLREPEKDLFSFENLAHDFPKKIQYQILNKNELFISVLGERDKGFSYKLIKQ